MTTDYTTLGKTMQLATEKQKTAFLDEIGNAFSAQGLPFIEFWLAFLRAGIAIGVILLSSRIIATPPPFVQGFALVLPAPTWGGLLLFSAAISYWGRMANNECIRRFGTTFGFWVIALLAGPLWLKAPGLCWVAALLLIPHAIVGGHLKRMCCGSQTKPLS